MKYKRSTACSSPPPFVSFVFFVVHSANQYLRFSPYDRPSRRIPSTRHHTVFPAPPRLRGPDAGAPSFTTQRARVNKFEKYFYLIRWVRYTAKYCVFNRIVPLAANEKRRIMYTGTMKKVRALETPRPRTTHGRSRFDFTRKASAPFRYSPSLYIASRPLRPPAHRESRCLRAKNRECESRRSNSSGRIALHKGRPEGTCNNDVSLSP